MEFAAGGRDGGGKISVGRLRLASRLSHRDTSGLNYICDLVPLPDCWPNAQEQMQHGTSIDLTKAQGGKDLTSSLNWQAIATGRQFLIIPTALTDLNIRTLFLSLHHNKDSHHAG